MSNLKKLDKELDETITLSEKNLGDIPPAFRGGWAASINEAKLKATKLVEEYTTTLMANGVAIFVDGPTVKTTEFEKAVRDNRGLVVDAQALYDRLTNAVFQTISSSDRSSGVEWGVAQTYRFHQALQEVLHEVRLSEMPMPPRPRETFLKGRQDVLDVVKASLAGSGGALLSRMYLQQELYRAARAIRYSGNVAPVFIVNATEEDAKGIGPLFAKGVSNLTIKETDVIDRSYLGNILKEQLKKKAEGEK